MFFNAHLDINIQQLINIKQGVWLVTTTRKIHVYIHVNYRYLYCCTVMITKEKKNRTTPFFQHISLLTNSKDHIWGLNHVSLRTILEIFVLKLFMVKVVITGWLIQIRIPRHFKSLITFTNYLIIVVVKYNNYI
jgi:hypothetical protein